MTRARKLLSIGVVVAFAASWWASERASKPMDAVRSERDAEQLASTTEADVVADSSERAEVDPIVNPVAVSGIERIKTIDDHDDPLSDVELFDVSASEPAKLGTTDANGVLVLPNPLRGPARLRTRASSELEQDHDLTAGTAGTFVVHVDVGDSIRGIVTLPSGAQPPVEITVIAWNDDLDQDVRDLAARAMRGDLGVPHARGAANGSFTIPRLRKGASYALAAGARGYMLKDYPSDPPHATAGGAEVTLVVQPVYAALVKLIDAESRGPVHVSSRLKVVSQVSARMVERVISVKPKGLGGGADVLGGLDPKLFTPTQDFGRDLHRHIQVCTDDTAPRRVGPFRLTAELPGYERATLEYFAEPLAQGLHELELALVPIAHQRGELAIRWKGVPDVLRMSVRPIMPWSTVSLASKDGTTLEYLIDDFSQPELVLDEIPCGDYDVWVTLQRQTIEPARSLRIGTAREVVELDVSQFGALAIDVRHADGSVYSSMLGVYLGSPTSEGSGLLVAFWNAPYVVLGLKPQSWRARLAKPKLPGSDQVVDVKAGELATLKFVLP